MVQNDKISGTGRNSKICLSFGNDSPSTFRDWIFPLFPKGLKSVTTSLQTGSGWVTISPDPSRGFFSEHAPTLSNKPGLWLRGTLSADVANNDVKLARCLTGHRFWHVSTPRVWLYRIIGGLVMGFVAADFLEWSLLFFLFLPLAIPSPCTPRGLKIWVEKRGFNPPILSASAPDADVQSDLQKRMADLAKAKG